MEWFRLYNEFRADAKLLKFTKSERYDLVCLLCMASESTERGAVFLDSEDLAASLGITEPEYIEFEARLVKKGIVYRREDGALFFLHWPIRQPDYDNAAERMRKLREIKRSEHVQNGVQKCSVLRDREIDREIERESAQKAAPAATAKARPLNFEQVKAYFLERLSSHLEAEKFFDHYEGNGWRTGRVAIKDWKATARNWMRNEHEFTNASKNGTGAVADTPKKYVVAPEGWTG